MNIALLYALFAAIATLVNILTQDLTLRIYFGEWPLAVAMVSGTATGLLSKYLLDKRFIFNYRSKHIRDDMRTFTGYTLTGIGTTLLFWAFEFGAELLFATPVARYSGAVLGLALGYMIKFQLDRRLVFVDLER